ncbi:hypothetical protein M440DRAFT_1401729 [Trichoderma longibrachiatum ATCC 18648]|uniref:Uncharacterized protein n=1 Tax=Trichoderma longibrachiatum ATCC 18648 TaxID=983965 RepID=A0A2T4C3Y6_TRILO|nr:hypothetical protein M440DRAFT_1401729 [Trichoderma longibrachiatum ATCC 18648]
MSPTQRYALSPSKSHELNTSANIPQPETPPRTERAHRIVSRGSSTGYSLPSTPFRLLQPAKHAFTTPRRLPHLLPSPRPTAIESFPPSRLFLLHFSIAVPFPIRAMQLVSGYGREEMRINVLTADRTFQNRVRLSPVKEVQMVMHPESQIHVRQPYLQRKTR